MSRIVLLVEDNDKLNEINRRALEGESYQVHVALTLAEARGVLSRIFPDVILMDVVLPDGNGIDFCAEIRQATDAHILFLTSRWEHADRLRGLSLGGDDYIAKPFRLDELLARVSAAMRRRDMHSAPPRRIEKGNLALDVIAGQAFVDGEDLLLSQKEFSLLLLFLRHENVTMRAAYLYECVWGQPMHGGDGAIKNMVSRLRRKLADSGFTVASHRGEGYRFEDL